VRDKWVTSSTDSELEPLLLRASYRNRCDWFDTGSHEYHWTSVQVYLLIKPEKEGATLIFVPYRRLVRIMHVYKLVQVRGAGCSPLATTPETSRGTGVICHQSDQTLRCIFLSRGISVRRPVVREHGFSTIAAGLMDFLTGLTIISAVNPPSRVLRHDCRFPYPLA
jgi:hypothetical protein